MNTEEHTLKVTSKQAKRNSGRPKVSDRRRKLLAQVHIPVSHGHITGEQRREFVFERFGVRSSKHLNDVQLVDLVADMRAVGWLDGHGAGGSQGDGRPTPKQWAYLAGLCIKRGWKKHRLDSKGLRTFVRRVAKVDGPRFLTAQQIPAVIHAMEQWLAKSPETVEQSGDVRDVDAKDLGPGRNRNSVH